MLLQVLSDASGLIQEHHVIVLTSLLLLVAVYKLAVYPLFVSPLRYIPGPYLHRISSIPALEAQRTFRWVTKTHTLHEKYGNIVVVSPTHVSFNGDPKYVNDIYLRNMPKTEYYTNFKFHGEVNMFCELDNDRHLKLRKMVQGLYQKSSVMSVRNSTRPMLVKKVRALIGHIQGSLFENMEEMSITIDSEDSTDNKKDSFPPSSKTRNSIEVYSLFASLAMDVVSAFELGSENGTNLLKDPRDRWIISAYKLVTAMVFWTTQMPRFWNWAAGSETVKAAEDIEKFHLGLYEQAEKSDSKSKYENLCTLNAFRNNGLTGLKAYSNVSDNLMAGHDTTSTHLTYMCYELSRPKHHHFQERLLLELRDAFGIPDHSKQNMIDDLNTINRLPFLEALVQENLRIHPSTRAAEPRKTDKPYHIRINGNKVIIPPGIGVSCQPYSMQRVSSVFPNPEEWNPERWLQNSAESDEQYNLRLKEMQRYMMPFGKGIRMCLGMNLALIEIKMALANIYWRYQSRICATWCPEISEKHGFIRTGSTFAGKDADESLITKRDSYVTCPTFDECWLSWDSV